MRFFKGANLHAMSPAAIESREAERRLQETKVRPPRHEQLTRSDLAVLLAIHKKKSLKIAELAARRGVKISTVKHRVFLLRDRGLVVRPDKPDYRRDFLKLTQDGRVLVEQHMSVSK